MTENNQPQAPERSYEGQLRQIAGDRQTSLAAYAADEIAWLRLELAQEQKRLDWSLKHGAIQGNQNDLLWCEWTDQNNTEVKES